MKDIIIGDYIQKEKLGKGQYGKVYKVCHKNDPNKEFALKKIVLKHNENYNYLKEALKKEKDIMKRVENENSVKLIESFEIEEANYLVLELCDSDLQKELNKRAKENKTFNELEIYIILTQLNNCFRKMREGNEKVVHRDLKLENIMIKYDKNEPILGFIVKVADFGFSKTMKDTDITGTCVGTPLMQAPEVLFRNDYGPKADLWSIGVIIYQLLYNQVPFKVRTKPDLKREIQNFKKISLPKNVNNPISKECFDLLNKLFEKNPDNRIEFEDYFKHKFFSIEHKKELLKIFGKKDDIIDKKEEIKIKRVILDLEEFEKKFIKLILIKEYEGYKIYKAKEKENNNIVILKEISREMIDKSEENKNKFNQEIQLFEKYEGQVFAKCLGIYETKTFYFMIFEYFNGNILDNFIHKRKGILNESLKQSIIAQVQSIFKELKEKNIIFKNISSKSLAFTYYQNENNFMIKLFDFYINSIFLKKNDDSLYFNFDDNQLNKENASNLNNFSENMKPVIKDEDLEDKLEIIKNKIEFILNYINELLDEKNIMEIEMMSDYIKEIIILFYFCLLECKLIINFLNTNADKNLNEIEKEAQEIHLLKIYLSEENKYEYSNINFLDDSKIWYYNKENPVFDYFIKIFRKLKNQIDLMLNKYIENNKSYLSICQKNNIDSEMVEKIIENCIKEGNLEKLFSKFFENIISIYPYKNNKKMLKELNIVKYILEYIIFMKLIIQNENINILNFQKVIENSKDTISFSTFIGKKIKFYKDKSILKSITDNDDETKENILLKKLINFYIKIIKFMK